MNSTPKRTNYIKSNDENIEYELSNFVFRNNNISCLSLSKDMEKIAVGKDFPQARIYSTSTRDEICSFEFDNDTHVTLVSFSHDSNQLSVLLYYQNDDDESVCDAKAIVFDLITKRALQVFQLPDYLPSSMAFSKDGKMLAIGSEDGMVIIYVIKNRKQVQFFDQFYREVKSLTFSNSGTHLLAGGYDDYAILYNLINGKIIHSFQRQDSILAVAISRDDTMLAIGGDDKKVKIYDCGTGAEIRTFQYDSMVYSIDFSPDGHNIIAGILNSVMINNIKNGTMALNLKIDGANETGGFLVDKKKIAFIGKSEVRMYTKQNWHVVKDFILLRNLVDSDRAHAKPSNKKSEIIRQWFITSLNFELFRFVLAFLY